MYSANQTATSVTSSKYKISRRGRKLQVSDDQRTLASLPREIPERTWAEIIQKEENDLIIFEIREDIIEKALKICYNVYMERQSIAFTVHCTAKAWLKIVDWHFLRHDPGEDPTAYPPCDIPNRDESWTPDVILEPSPKDSWARHALSVLEECKPVLQKSSSSDSLDYPDVQSIESEYWFPGKVELPGVESSLIGEEEINLSYDQLDSNHNSESTNMAIESEILEKVTDYSQMVTSPKRSSMDVTSAKQKLSAAGGGDVGSLSKISLARKAKLGLQKKKDKKAEDIKSKLSLPPLEAMSRGDIPMMPRSRASTISDCRLRSLRQAIPCIPNKPEGQINYGIPWYFLKLSPLYYLLFDRLV